MEDLAHAAHSYYRRTHTVDAVIQIFRHCDCGTRGILWDKWACMRVWLRTRGTSAIEHRAEKVRCGTLNHTASLISVSQAHQPASSISATARSQRVPSNLPPFRHPWNRHDGYL